MNELEVWCGIRFSTNSNNFDEAMKELEAICDKHGILLFAGQDGVLFDENGNEID